MRKTKKLMLVLAGINAFLSLALLMTSLLYTVGFQVMELPIVSRIFLEALLITCPIVSLALSIMVGFVYMGKYEGDGDDEEK